MYTQSEAKTGIVAEWHSWSAKRSTRTGTDMFHFYLTLEKEASHWLRFRCSGDKWQHVHGWLEEYERFRV